ncbi:DUF1878 domain-containing protein [Bacillus mycoides]|uniref:DUF1878 domain-containing protein n=1 Tax=Bacillus mycoides TaxID=1405 RepID=UPI00273B117F|nr:DUF1878 domain-containing protein [Bacillus mycoides]
MENTELEERLALIEFRQQLLFENTGLSRFLFECNVTKLEYRSIMGVMDSYREKIGRSEEVSNHMFEQEIYEAVPSHRGQYHFAEGLAQEFHDLGRWEEVFRTLYASRV